MEETKVQPLQDVEVSKFVGDQLWELSGLQLALVGGGSGDVTLS